ncbi:MAG: hypothetical protein JXR83_11155 [Deltaproteobacteria bacterium]|nr:hypothetical protein [Deltaproteobacteria bacterium]
MKSPSKKNSPLDEKIDCGRSASDFTQAGNPQLHNPLEGIGRRSGSIVKKPSICTSWRKL